MKKLFILFLVACVSISAKSQDQKGLIAENFNSNKLNWPIYADESVVWKVENGMYIRQNLKNLCYSTLKPVELDPEGDYWAYLNTKHLDGVTNQAYGISFGALDANNEFAFVITSTGHYEIYKRENDKLTELVKWTETDAINKYESTGNSLYFIKTGKDWNFKINGKFVYSMPAQPLMGYKFGVTSCGIQTVGFDELNVNQVLEHSTPPLRTIVKDTVLFKDDFSNNNNRWAEYDEDGNSAHVKDGKYRVDHNISDVDFSFKTVYINEYQDYSVSVKTNLFRKGSSVDYGMCWGFKDVNNYYGFIITADGLYSVYRVQAGKLRDFTNLISNNAIRKDENSINNLLMKQEDKSWIFFINDQQVFSMPSQSLYGDHIGVMVGGKQGVEFDDLVVKQSNVTRFYKTKLCLIEKGVLKEIDAEQSDYEITAAINGKSQTIRRYSPPDLPGYAENLSWFKNNETIQLKGMNFSKSGERRTFGINELNKIGEYKSVGIYIDAEKTSLDSAATIYVPVRIGCLWQPYTILCPTFELNTPYTAAVNDTLTFTSEVTGANITKFNWTISDGKIIKGQGTRSILVSTVGVADRSILDVSVELNPRSPGCENKKSKTVRIGTRPAQGGRPQRTRN